MVRRHQALLFALSICTPAPAQTIPFEFQSHPECPIVFVDYTATAFRVGADRRQFLTVKNSSAKATSSIIFQQAISNGTRMEIVALEPISFIMRSGEKRRISIGVGQVWNRIQGAGNSGGMIGKPVISVVTVEFLDGTVWNAPVETAHK